MYYTSNLRYKKKKKNNSIIYSTQHLVSYNLIQIEVKNNKWNYLK